MLVFYTRICFQQREAEAAGDKQAADKSYWVSKVGEVLNPR